MATLAKDTFAAAAIDPLDVSRSELYLNDTWREPFARLRAEAPVHTPSGRAGDRRLEAMSNVVLASRASSVP